MLGIADSDKQDCPLALSDRREDLEISRHKLSMKLKRELSDAFYNLGAPISETSIPNKTITSLRISDSGIRQERRKTLGG